jgi:hypothetical protein
MTDRPYRTHARVFFEDGTLAYAAYDAGASLVDAAMFESLEGIGTSHRADLADRSCHVPRGPDDLRAVHTGKGTAVVPISACERVVVEASDHHGAHWWTGLAFRRGLILATNRDGSEVYLKNDGLFRPHPLHEGMADEFPVTGVPFADVDFRDLDSERVEPEGVDVIALLRR